MYGDRGRAPNPEGDRQNTPTSRSDSPRQSHSKTPKERAQLYSRFQPLPDSQAGSSTRPQTLEWKEGGSGKESPSHDIELIKSISDSDIGNLQRIMMSRANEQSQNLDIPPGERQRYIDGKAIYESAFQSIDEDLKGKSPDERMEIIQGYLKGNDRNRKKIFEKLLRSKQNEQDRQTRSRTLKRESRPTSEFASGDKIQPTKKPRYLETYQVGESSESHRQPEAPSSDSIREGERLVTIKYKKGGANHPDGLNFRVTDLNQLTTPGKNEPGIYLKHRNAQNIEVYIPWEVMNLDSHIYNYQGQIKRELNNAINELDNTIYEDISSTMISTTFSRIKKDNVVVNKIGNCWLVRIQK